jgi:hypothetical protein
MMSGDDKSASLFAAAACRKALYELRRLRDEKPKEWDALVDAGLCEAWDVLKVAVVATCGWCHRPNHGYSEHCSLCQMVGSKGLLACDCGVGTPLDGF